MPSFTFKKIKTKDEDLTRVQNAVASAVDPLLANPILDGRLVEGIVLTAAVFTNVPHKLGRKVRGFFIADRNAQATVWRDPSTANPDEAKFLRLTTDATVTINLWVY